ncbi:MAG: DNRLRE domain-containing protein [Phycisphaerae bacterium]
MNKNRCHDSEDGKSHAILSAQTTAMKLAICAGLLLGHPDFASAQRLHPNGDNWLSSCSSSADWNSGADQELRVRTTAVWGDVKNQRSLLHFDLSEVPVNADYVTGATLGLYLFTYHWDSPEGRTYNVHRVTTPWDEMESSWRARNAYQTASPVYWDTYLSGVPAYRPGGGDFDPVPASSVTVPAVGEWVTWDVKDLAKAWLDADVANYGLLIRDATEFTSYPGYDTISPLAQFRSRDYGNSHYWPYLQIDFLTLSFSIDIGSDHELSDPSADGNEAYDPGDVYAWKIPPVDQPGRDGFLDDSIALGIDVAPDAPDEGTPPMTRVPVGSGGPADYGNYFDLDGHDQINVSLADGVLIPPNAPLSSPLVRFASDCIHEARYLLVSYDDDGPDGWPSGDVPVAATSPIGQVYGSDARADEIVGLVLGAEPLPARVLFSYSVASEIDLHASLGASPDAGQEEDDDVDSLDLTVSRDACPVWLFTVDHEATGGLYPGTIYESVLGSAPVPVIQGTVHLGLPAGTDIDAFELVWLSDPNTPSSDVLTLLFSVDDDDQLTPDVDESGGLDSAMIYRSYLTGTHQPFLSHSLADDVDALAAWREPFKLCSRPVADVNADGHVDHADLDQFEACAGGPAVPWSASADPQVCTCLDQDNDGDVDQSDFGLFQQCYSGPDTPADPHCAD